MSRGDELTLRVESLAYGGEGVARVGEDGYVVFVAGAVPGDVARAVVYKRKRAYAHARAVEILEPSAERVAPAASHPGAPWQVLPYERQLEIKRSQVKEALTRIGRLSGFQLDPIVPATEQWRYRNKLEYSFGGGEDGELILGFHAPARWNKVIAIEDCLLASPLGNAARAAALRWARAEGLRPWERAVRMRDGSDDDRAGGGGEHRAGADRDGCDRNRGGGGGAGGSHSDGADRVGPGADGKARLRNLVVREGRRTGKLQVRLVSTTGDLDVGSLAQALSAEVGADALSGVLWTCTDGLGESTGGGTTELVWGEAQLPERMCGLELAISHGAFLQTNTEMAEVLYEIVRELADLKGFERVYDLYCGIGVIAMTLAPQAGELWGMDIVPEAIADAIACAERNAVSGARFFAGDVRLGLRELSAKAGLPDVVVLDPPRAGLSEKVLRRVIECKPRRIVYVSCNPTTLAPNARQLVDAGWRLETVRPVDMFPQTHHIECVALLTRADGG